MRTDQVEDEVKRLGQCAHAGVEDMGACLGINGLDQVRLRLRAWVRVRVL